MAHILRVPSLYPFLVPCLCLFHAWLVAVSSDGVMEAPKVDRLRLQVRHLLPIRDLPLHPLPLCQRREGLAHGVVCVWCRGNTLFHCNRYGCSHYQALQQLVRNVKKKILMIYLEVADHQNLDNNYEVRR